MQIERKALYNLLRMKWLRNSELKVEDWQVQDYRQLSNEQLFERLADLDIQLEPQSFKAYALKCESPEELTDLLVSEDDDAPHQDQVFLLVFELWRRFAPEQACLSLFCDELDYQIYQYDHGEDPDPLAIQDALANLENLLKQGSDEGEDPLTIFESLSAGCAHELQDFLYDFIAEQIDHDNLAYASDLLDAFYDYVGDVLWFDFLRARLLEESDPDGANEIITQLLEDTEDGPDLELYLELLGFLAQGGDVHLFNDILVRSCALIQVEEDFLDLLELCVEFLQRLDRDVEERAVQSMLDERVENDPEAPVDQQDPAVLKLKTLIASTLSSST